VVLVRRLNFSTIYIFADRNSCTYRLLYLYSTYRSLNGSKWIRRNVIQSRRLPDFAFHFTFHCMNCKHNSCRSPDRNFYLVSLRICNRREARRRSSQRSAVMKYIYMCSPHRRLVLLSFEQAVPMWQRSFSPLVRNGHRPAIVLPAMILHQCESSLHDV